MTDIEALSTMLARICPMFLLIDETGHIARAGPTLQKLRPGQPLEGTRFLEQFRLLRPRSVSTTGELLATAGAKIRLELRDKTRTALKGHVVPMPGGPGALVNLSFGISVLDAVRDYELAGTDFAPTDLAIELLYLVEANSAAMDASRKLNRRLEGAKIAAEEQAFTDTLTGLKNRRALDHVLARLIERNGDFALMHLDLDYFKTVNDGLGHAAGDHVLQHVAGLMVGESRADDVVARVGGDEFILVFRDMPDQGRLASIAERLIRRIEEPIGYNGDVCRISTSIGIVLASQIPDIDAAALMGAADQALYAAKRSGRARYRMFAPGADPTL